MKEVRLQPIAFVKNSSLSPTGDHCGEIVSEIKLAEHIPRVAFSNIELFSHLEIIFFNQAYDQQIMFAAHPRENISYPIIGIFAQRKKDRPNHNWSLLSRINFT